MSGVFDLAYNGRGHPVQVRVISERQRIPTRYLEQIFQRLRKAELVAGKRGPGGGYVLAREPREITLRDIVEAVEGPFERAGLSPEQVAAAPDHRPRFLWSLVAENLTGALAEIDLDTVCRRAAHEAVPRSEPAALVPFTREEL
jgi:Rrf2 family protein